jgi:hypothetical protein
VLPLLLLRLLPLLLLRLLRLLLLLPRLLLLLLWFRAPQPAAAALRLPLLPPPLVLRAARAGGSQPWRRGRASGCAPPRRCWARARRRARGA